MASGKGFDGRVFLHEYEWQTYLRRMPVRYIRKRKHTATCAICGAPASAEKPFEHAHRIGFSIGVAQLGLTPDFLDQPWNTVTTHRGMCNSAAELSLEDAMNLLAEMGHELPSFIKPQPSSK